ncbi:hypothetical protein FRB91_009895 [Serendipita sp. 411]|nr:hypothetical protein FRC19_003614 [Serendipita sp. 401]KAG8832520.1 hypothetical protein FRC18_004884 [Serendipita sp. 400]KAG8861095.1 hypothetical protein FRB91_009895 [Serendipita sp. 411]
MPTEWSVGVRVGVGILSIAGVLSFFSTAILVGFILISASKHRSEDHDFSRSHLAAYFVCLLFCDAVEGVSSMLSFGPVAKDMITEGALCTAQAALKQFGLVGAALWLLVISIHTFSLLFYQVHPPRWVFFWTLSGVWVLILVIILIGPAILRPTRSVPFYGNVGMWCWIRTEYSVERYALHYGWQWLSAFVSLILYTLLFFRLRGNIQVDGWHFHFQHRPNFTILPVAKLLPTTGPGIRRLSSTSSRHMVPMVDLQVQKIARNMMLYPIAYIFLLLPQSLVRFLDSAAHKKIPDSIKLLAATLLWLNGLVDAILFTLTRSSVTADPSFLPHSLRTFFGLSSEDESKESVRQVTYHHSTQQISIPSMGQTYGISIEANIERKSEKWPSSRVTYSHGCQRPVGLHGAVTSLNHHRRDSSNLTVYSNYDRRKFSVEDECGHTFYASPMKANEKPQVGEEEGEFIQYLQPQLQPPRPVAGAPAHRYSLGCGHGDLQGYFYDDDPVISFSVIPHPYNGQTTMH